MSSGGSNYSTGTTGGGNQVSVDTIVDTPASNPNSFTKTSAPGGKGGFPSAQSPYAQQQPQMYMPPQQPSMYQQAFPQQYSGYNNYRNAYARPYSPQTPIEARPPMDEMRYAPGGLEQAPGQLMSDSWGRRPGREYAVPTNQMSQTMPGGGLGGMPKQTVDPYQGSYQISEIPYRGGSGLTPVAAVQGVLAEPNYSGGLGSLISSGLGGLDRNYVPSEAISTSDRRFNPMTGTSGPSKTVYTNAAQPLDWINTPNGRLWNA